MKRGRLASEVFPGLDRYWVDICDRAVTSGVIESVEHELTPNGRWYRSNFYPIGGDRLLSLYDDITEQKRAESTLRESQERQAFLLKFSDALRTESDADAVATRAMEMLIEQIGADRSYIFSWELENDIGYTTHQVGNDRAPPLPPVMHPSDFPASVRISSEGTLVIDDIANQPGLSDSDRANIKGVGMVGLVSATLRKWDHPLWSMVAVSAEPRQWTQGEIKLVEEVAERTWAAVERARGEAALRDSEEKFRTLFESIDEMFCILEMVEDEKGGIVDFRYIEANKEHDRRSGLGYVVGKLASEVVPDAEPYWFESFGEVARTGEPKRYENYNHDTGRWYDTFLSRVGGPGSRRVCVVRTTPPNASSAKSGRRSSSI